MSTETPWCPSSSPDPGSVVFAVRAETDGVLYLDDLVPTSQSVLDLTGEVDPREVFRFGSPCATSQCMHFARSKCTLVERIVDALPTVVDGLPACRLRARCRWFSQEGGAACRRCPAITTLQRLPDEATLSAANPSAATPVALPFPLFTASRATSPARGAP